MQYKTKYWSTFPGRLLVFPVNGDCSAKHKPWASSSSTILLQLPLFIEQQYVSTYKLCFHKLHCSHLKWEKKIISPNIKLWNISNNKEIVLKGRTVVVGTDFRIREPFGFLLNVSAIKEMGPFKSLMITTKMIRTKSALKINNSTC